MRLFRKPTEFNMLDDSSLVMASLGGDHDAYGQIVTRYQSLLCSIAYSSVGDIKHSEDIAQETFVEAWKKLETLRDPEKLKSWLCGILRFKVSRYRRKEENQPIKDADELVNLGENEANQARIEDAAIQEQQQNLLWTALENMPENYREPLILYYREQQSVEYVASELDLSIDAVKQRLSRGRKLLQKTMISFVEDTLEKSKPGTAFTLSVMAVVSGLAPPTKAAALGAGAFKTGSYFSWTSIITLIAVFSGVISGFFGFRASLDQSRTRRERRRTIVITALFFFFAIVYTAGLFSLKYFALNNLSASQYYAFSSQILVLAFIASNIFLVYYLLKGLKKVRAQERQEHPHAFLDPIDNINSKEREYKSRTTLAGIPLFHFRFGIPETNDKPVFAWVAGGECAYGLLFAWGCVAIAPVSVGIISVGVLSVGVIGIGLLGLGTVAIGLIGFGASAVAYKAYASLSSLGWESAFSNGFSISVEAAIGPIAIAKHFNNEHAAEITNLSLLSQSYLWVLAVITTLVILPSVWHSNAVRKRMRKQT